MKLTKQQIEKLFPLTRDKAAYTELMRIVEGIEHDKEVKYQAAAKAALLDPSARPQGLLALGALMQAKDIKQIFIDIGAM